jgi:hypothetical protein
MSLDDVKRCRARNRDAKAKRALLVVWVLSTAAAAATATTGTVEDNDDAGMRDAAGWKRFTRPFEAASSIATGTEAGEDTGARAKTAVLLVGSYITSEEDDALRIPLFFNAAKS